MTSPSSRGRHVAAGPRRPALPAALLVLAAAGFGGLAVVPGAEPVRVTAAAALDPQPVPPVPTSRPHAGPVPNAALGAALEQGLAVALSPPPAPPERASRDRSSAAAQDASAEVARPGLGRRTSGYGRRWGRLHAGIDLAAGTGSPVRAALRGTVQSARRESGYGLCVRVLHPDGTVTVYAHMSKLLVEAGQRVDAGERLGLEGNTGRSTGPHLHFEVRVNGTPIDPAAWLRKHGVKV